MPDLPYIWKVVTGKKHKVIGQVVLYISVVGDRAVIPIEYKSKFKSLTFPFRVYTIESSGPDVRITYCLDATKINKKHLKIFLSYWKK